MYSCACISNIHEEAVLPACDESENVVDNMQNEWLTILDWAKKWSEQLHSQIVFMKVFFADDDREVSESSPLKLFPRSVDQ